MSPDVATVRESEPLIDAIKLMINAGVSALPVVDDGGALVGVLSEYDVIQHVLESPGAFDQQAHLEPQGALPEVHARAMAGPVASRMTRPAISVAKDTPLKDIADLMVKHRIHSIPVIGGGAVAGMVNRVALVKALLSRPDTPAEAAGGAASAPADVEDEDLRSDVVAVIRKLGLPVGGGFDVVARHGAVHLWGNAYDEEDHRAYCAAAAKVRGAREVHSHMQVRSSRIAGTFRR